MNVQNKKEKFLKRLGESKSGETVKVINFKRKHFNENLTTSVGFGVQDLKDEPKEFYKWLITEDYDVKMEPTKNMKKGFGVLVTLIKTEHILMLG